MLTPDTLTTLDNIQRRVLWLATRIVHEANHVRPNPSGIKVGGHQASSASMVSIMTALYFHFLEAGDRVAVKPHASPVFHAIQYLLGQLPQSYLTTLRGYGGLQAYPSRTKDPDVVDFSTGSVGLGAVAPAFAALTHHYAKAHFGEVSSKRFVAIIGDAELDEGNIWEALFNDWMPELGNVLWIVDLNRQSLDRVVPGIRANHLKSMFAQCGWQVLEAKYGRRLQSLFALENGELLRKRIDDMSNEEYQFLIRLPGDELRQRLIRPNGRKDRKLEQLVQEMPDAELPAVIGNLGGHDLGELIDVLEQSQSKAASGQPSVIFAYTIKGWGLPIAGDPLNHSKLLSPEQIETTRLQLGILNKEDEWSAFAPATAEAELCQEAARRLYAAKSKPAQGLSPEDVPESVSVRSEGRLSTQQSFGQLLVSLSRDPVLTPRLVTTSPDVSTSTNLSGWIAKQGVFAFSDREIYEMEENRALSWRYGPHGQHIELGISEMNLFMALGMLGLSAELCGQQLIPIGTVYDPFVLRGLDALIYGLYSNARFIIVATPSGVSLAAEGGAHQSTVTPALGSELPNLNSYEPCFAQELNWIMLEAIRQCCRSPHVSPHVSPHASPQGRSTYLRLSTKPIDQALLAPALERLGTSELRRQVLAGGYRLVEQPNNQQGNPLVQIVTTGVMAPEAAEAAQLLQKQGIHANVLNLTSPRALYEQWQKSQWGGAYGASETAPFDWLIPPAERHAPIVTIQDGASHNLAWLGSIYGAQVVPLGVDAFGQSGSIEDLYHHFGLDSANIVKAAQIALNRSQSVTIQPVPVVQPIPQASESPVEHKLATPAIGPSPSTTSHPHFYCSKAIMMDAALALCNKLNTGLPDPQKVTLNELLIKAASLTLREFPTLNIPTQGSAIQVGLVMATDGGLITAVYLNSEKTALATLAAVNKTRLGQTTSDPADSASFLIYHLGSYDLESCLPLPDPQGRAILAVATAKPTPVIEAGQVVVRTQLLATLVTDPSHADGAQAASFLQRLKEKLEKPLQVVI